MRPLARSVFCLIILLTVSRTAALGADNLADEVRKIAERAIEDKNAVGLSIGVAKGDKVLLAAGYGLADLESQTPATEKTVYRIGSITKQFTAALIMQLVEQKKIALGDVVTDHLPDFPNNEREVTIVQLLQHTSGMKSFTGLSSYRKLMRQDVTHDDLIARFADLPYDFEPGREYRYNNSGYYLLGVIIEAVGNGTYEEQLNKRIFEPLKMTQSFYDRSARIIPHRARGYDKQQDGFVNCSYLSMTQPFSAGALASTVGDLMLWQRALLKGKVVQADSYEKMATAGGLPDGRNIDYGFGLAVREQGGRKTIQHGGGINGFRSQLTYFPESDHTVVVLANSSNADAGRIARQVAKILFAEKVKAESDTEK